MTASAAPPPARPRRSRARALAGPAVAGWLLAEIWLLMAVARAAGGPAVLALLVAGAVCGAAAVTRAGRSAWRGLTAAAGHGRAGGAGASGGSQRPEAGRTRGTRHPGLAMLGGLLLIVPGLISDAAGLLCLFPPTREALSRVLGRALAGGRTYRDGSLGDLLSYARIHRPDGKVIPGEVVDEREPGPRTGNDGAGAAEVTGAAETRKNPGPQR